LRPALRRNLQAEVAGLEPEKQGWLVEKAHLIWALEGHRTRTRLFERGQRRSSSTLHSQYFFCAICLSLEEMAVLPP
jgi:hypothetical protein